MQRALVSPTPSGNILREPVERTQQPPGDVLVLEQVSSHSWRVCDSRIPAGHVGRMVGFVDEHDDHIEIMQIADTFIWTSFPTMTSALHHISATHVDMTHARGAGDLSWVG
jgi:hypothetical protein